MRKLIADKVAAIQPSGIRKFFDIVSEMDDVISLGVGEPDFDTPWHIRDEGIYSLEKGRTYYTSNAAALPDPVGEILDTLTRPNGLVIIPVYIVHRSINIWWSEYVSITHSVK